jgi:hypothetical protein
MNLQSASQAKLNDPQDVAQRKTALKELGAKETAGGKTGLITQKTAAALLGITTYAPGAICPPAISLPSLRSTSAPRTLLYDPVDLLPLKNDPRVEAARRRRRSKGRTPSESASKTQDVAVNHFVAQGPKTISVWAQHETITEPAHTVVVEEKGRVSWPPGEEE